MLLPSGQEGGHHLDRERGHHLDRGRGGVHHLDRGGIHLLSGNDIWGRGCFQLPLTRHSMQEWASLWITCMSNNLLP